MSKSLKQAIAEFVQLAKECPENLQEKCFALLLEDFLASHGTDKRMKQTAASDSEPRKTESSPENQESKNAAATEEEDFADSDLHIKARKFLKDSNLTIDHINSLFYKSGDAIEPLYEELNTTKLVESQIRVALLQALSKGIGTGDFEFNGEEVRAEVQLRKCYDPPNFTRHFKTNKSLFENFEKYDKNAADIRLSKEGRQALADLIRELQ